MYIYLNRTSRISRCLNGLLHEVLVGAASIILTNFFVERKPSHFWKSYTKKSRRILRNVTDHHYKGFIENMLERLRVLGCVMGLRLHYLHSQFDYFQDKL